MNLALIVELACVWEATVPKPGNVHPGASFIDMTFDDFVRSAQAIAPVLGNPAGKTVGQLVLECVLATQRTVGKNTNLGIILLLAPLVKAWFPASLGRQELGVSGDESTSIISVLQQLSIDDARLVYQAIRLTQPGGMGKVSSQDVSEEPTITLLDAMRLAADRDLIARQYVTGYHDLWEVLLPALEKALQGMGSVSTRKPWHTISPPLTGDAIQHTFLVSLATLGDTLIARKCGPAIAGEAQTRAQAVIAGQQTMEELDAWLRADGHRRNPGTTADLLCATLFLALVRGTLPACFP